MGPMGSSKFIWGALQEFKTFLWYVVRGLNQSMKLITEQLRKLRDHGKNMRIKGNKCVEMKGRIKGSDQV